MSKYYYHGVYNIYKMFDIIKSGGIKSKRLLGYEYGYGYNGYDYVSICNKTNDYEINDNKVSNSSFVNYIYNKFCFIISDQIPAIKTYYIDEDSKLSSLNILKSLATDIEDRYSDMFDEFQVRDQILLKDIVGIGIPFDVNNKKDIKLEKLYDIAHSLGWDIVDTSHIDFVEEYENCKIKNKTNIVKEIEFRRNI